MAKKADEVKPQAVKDGTALKSCFVIGPISDVDGYAPGHFTLVYAHLIKPACANAGFEATRGDDTPRTNYIALDVLRQIITSDIVLCDLSSKNPNVMYELGIRQAFNKPVVLMKDRKTDRVFDIQGLRTFDYDETLRVDLVQGDIDVIAAALKSTSEAPTTDVNSLVELLGVKAAELPKRIELSDRESIILNAIKELGDRIDSLSSPRYAGYSTPINVPITQAWLGSTFPDVVATTFPTYAMMPSTPSIRQQRVEEVWSEGRFSDLVGRRLLHGGVRIGIVTEVDLSLNRLVFLDANNREKYIEVTDPRFRDLAIYEEV